MAPMTFAKQGVRARRSVSAGGLGGGGGPNGAGRPADLGMWGSRLRKEFVKMFDYDSWAPRSARAWRLGEVPTEAQTKQDASEVDELVASLQQRVREEQGLALDPFESSGVLDGRELKELMLRKYGVCYDMNFKCVSLPLKRVLSLNVMWSYMGQKSFPLSESEYEMKLDGIAQMVRQLNRESVVREFFAKEPKAERGLPAYPNVGTAVIIRFPDLDDAIINEYF